MAVTMKDVARSAQVSVSTVSRVLTGSGGVSAATREVVKRACKDLGYQPDGLASALRSGASSTIGILVPDITNPIFPAVIREAEHELAAAELDVVLCDADNDVKLEAQRFDTLLRRRVDAVLVCPVDAKRSAASIRRAAKSMRVLQLFRHAVDDADLVAVDNVSGMNQVVDHVASVGARTAQFLGLHRGMSSLTERAHAFHDACARVGIDAPPAVEVDLPDLQHGRDYVRRAVATGDLPDAVVCASDELAFGVVTELHAVGVSCPEDVLVTGYDDTPAAELLGLTTVRQPLTELGREAARLLRQESSVSRHLRLTPTLIVRSSTTRTRSLEDGEPLKEGM